MPEPDPKIVPLVGKKHILGLTCAVVCLLVAAPGQAASLNVAERALLAEMNGARAEHGLRPLRVDDALQRAARAHSLDMIRRDYFAHGAFASRLVSFGVRGPEVGENLAWGVGATARARAVVGMWLRSPGHRRNLLRPGFSRVGVASLPGPFHGLAVARVVTADFAGT